MDEGRRRHLCDDDTCLENNQGFPSARLNGPYMDVSPGDENVVYVGTPGSGVYYSLNGGAKWTQLSTGTIPAGGLAGNTNQGNLIAFDPSDATGNTVVITSYGHGVWQCTNARTSPSCTQLIRPACRQPLSGIMLINSAPSGLPTTRWATAAGFCAIKAAHGRYSLRV